MRAQVKKDILRILSQAAQCLSRNNTPKLAELSNQTIHNASIFQDEDSVSLAVVIYAVSKICEREQGAVDKSLIQELRQAHAYLSRNDFGSYKRAVHRITHLILRLDHKLKLYIEEVINQAQIRKGSKIYDHGISLARASEMLNVSQWELMSYVGKTKIIDRFERTPKLAQRLSFARRIFNL